jgi:hypothetical protein
MKLTVCPLAEHTISEPQIFTFGVLISYGLLKGLSMQKAFDKNYNLFRTLMDIFPSHQKLKF